MKTKTVSISTTTSGILSYPHGVEITRDPIPLLLCLHGFASDQDEVNGFYVNLSQALVDKHMAVLRFDFSGFGKSQMPMKTASITTMLNDLYAAHKLMKSLNPNFTQIGILGFSLGAAIALIGTKSIGTDFLILISPALNLLNDAKLFIGEEAIEKISAGADSCTIQLSWTQVEIGKDFIASLEKYKPLCFLQKYIGPLLCVCGTHDFSCANVKQIMDIAVTNNKQSKLLPNLNHIFNDEDSKSYLSEIINFICDWLTENNLFSH